MRDYFNAFAFLALVAAAAGLMTRYSAIEIGGEAFVLDGDSLRIGADEVRLEGIDAPERNQTCRDAADRAYNCGDRAREHLRTLVGRRSVTCTSGGRDRFGRALGVCQRGDDPISLNARMVKDGWAIDFGGFAREEGDARRAKRGLWGGTFEAPRDFRDRATSVTRQ